MTGIIPVLASFLASAVEGVEGLTVVLAAGVTRGWRSALAGLAALGAGLALLLVTVTGLVVSGPLTRIPENALKYVVGLLLSSFGTFWAAEGAGVTWPVSDASILIILAVYGLVSYGYVLLLRRRHEAQELPHVA